MIHITHSIPEECPDCGGLDLSIPPGDENSLACENCGACIVVYGREEETAIAQGLTISSEPTCPHCSTVGEINVAAGEEECEFCGLDPNIADYLVEDLMHLWKEGSGIGLFMKGGKPYEVGGNLYNFLISECGPHCPVSSECEQSRRDLRICYSNHRRDNVEKERGFKTVGKGRRKNKKKREQLERQKLINVAKTKAQVVFAAGGWYERALNCTDETNNKEQSEDTGRRFGT